MTAHVVSESEPSPSGANGAGPAGSHPAGSDQEDVASGGSRPDGSGRSRSAPGGSGAGETSEVTELVDSDGAGSQSRFTVRLSNFEGPFDLLLQLISQHEMDVTEVALHQVTDDFIAHIKGMGERWDLDETTEFLVVAATLLDLKAARLLPAAEVENEEDLALLEARDLLFARLLQYRAYKQVAALFAELEAGALRRYPRSVAMEDRYLGLLPEVMIGVDPQRFAEIAAAVFRPKPPPAVATDHLHAGKVSVREHAASLRILLAQRGNASFSELVSECGHTREVVARFLALLELYREANVDFVQEAALGELDVRWTGGSVEEARRAADADRASVDDEEYK